MSQISETSFKLELNLLVADLPAAIRFYGSLLGLPPVRQWPEFARFDIDEPPVSLTLRSGTETHAGAINHVGFRLDDVARLIDVQHRLELAGIATEREEGVECCYSQQTKFWVTDPDGNLWEIYTLDDDADSPAVHASADSTAEGDPPVIWGHRQGEPLPIPLAMSDDTVDEIHLDRSWNHETAPALRTSLLQETWRVLKPRGSLAIAIELPHPDAIAEVLNQLTIAGFNGVQIEHWRPSASTDPPSRGLLRVSAVKGSSTVDSEADSWIYQVLYRGPGLEVELDDGRVFHRGDRVAVDRATWDFCQSAECAAHFTCFPLSKGPAALL